MGALTCIGFYGAEYVLHVSNVPGKRLTNVLAYRMCVRTCTFTVLNFRTACTVESSKWVIILQCVMALPVSNLSNMKLYPKASHYRVWG